jgi:hypothetical protein
MHIFEQELQDGLADKLTASASISYASFAEPCVLDSDNRQKLNYSVASYDDSDLYYVQSILVTSSWNKNDDIFDKVEVWKAKNTPEHKPTNLEHNEDIIIGHIISNWPINDDGELISDNTPLDQLPNKYHILTGSVIYTGFSNPELRARSAKLIEDIQNGTKYVSMECFFKGFDYGVLNANTNEYKVLARNEETAYLTKFLKAYGGVGQHEDYKIGRVLRNITFTGKGFVDKPANIDSIIFTKNLFSEVNNEITEEKNDEILKSGVFISQSNINSETITMSSAQPEQEVAVAEEIHTPVVDTTVLASEIAQLQEANKKLEATLSELTQNRDAEILATKEEAAKKMDMMQEEKKKMEEEKTKMKAELDAIEEVLAGYRAKEQEMMKKEKTMKRKASLTEQGVDDETAATVVEQFESMTDEAFDAMTVVFAAMTKKKMQKEDEAKAKEDEAKAKEIENTTETTIDASVLETAEVENEVNLSVGGEVESEIDSTRAALIDFVRSKIGKKVK